ncbi:MAG: MFS transporter [Bryobacteraceae bacterium]|jgi:ACS family hexuronate transporter-like MFS transporter
MPKHTVSHLRWYICGLLFFATTVCYVDRQVLGFLKPVIAKDLGWSESDYGWVVFGFMIAYAIMTPISGRVIDWLGTRTGYALAATVWGLASMSHALARNALQFGLARFGLGLGEAANFPAAVKAVADWFPRRERALATGIFNSGPNIGTMAGATIAPFVAWHFGWRWTFVVTGSLDLVFIASWLLVFRQPREHSLLSQAELALIESDREIAPSGKIRYAHVLWKRQTWGFLIAKFLTDPVWWFYLYWVPGYLNTEFHLDISHLGPPVVIIYAAASVGSVFGGWLSGVLLKRGWAVTPARKTAMLVCALAVLPVVFVQFANGRLWVAVALLSLATAAHQGWSSNLFTVASDVFPRAAVGSVVGLGGMGGSVGGMLVAPAIGYWLRFSHSAYGPVFFVLGFMYLLALAILHLLVPKLDPAQM